LRGQAAGSLLPAAADEFFRAERVTAGEAVRGFAILVVVSGTGALEGDWGRTPIGRGATLVLPHGAGSARLTGSLELVRCGPAR
jgi:mannose-6-phosphate isomerase